MTDLKLAIVSGLFIALLIGADCEAATNMADASASIISLDGKNIGTATFQQTPDGVLIRIDAQHLPPGIHAVHIHAVGKCEPADKFASAGSHFNPTGKTHGSMSMDPEHAGDMPNQTADKSGALKARILNANLSVASLFGADGTAIVIHAMPDDYKTQPTGNAGDRIACGVIKKKF